MRSWRGNLGFLLLRALRTGSRALSLERGSLLDIILRVQDPIFNAPIYANLFDDEDGEGYSLIWSRPTGRRSD